MNHLQQITFAQQLMFACNDAHNSTLGIFMDVHFKAIDECIEFDILTSNIGHASQICELLNLTLHIEVNTNPATDKTLNFYIT